MSGAARARAFGVLRRLIREGKADLWSAYGALGCIFVESVVDTGVISVLLALMFLAIAPSPEALMGGGMPAASVDWIQRLGWAGGGSEGDRLRSLLLFAGLMMAAWLVKCAFGFGRSYLSQRLAQRLIREMRGRLYEHLVGQSLAFHRSRKTGDLLSRVSNDVTVLQRVLSTDLMEAARAPITILIALGLMISLEWRLTILVLACVPGISLVIAHSGDRLRRLTREVQHKLGGLNAYLQERLNGMETVQLFGMEGREVARFGEINEDNYRANMRVAKVVAVLSPLVELISAVGMVVLIYVAGYLTIKEHLAVATLIAFAYAGQKLGSKLGLVGKIWLSGQQAAAAGDRIFEILDAREAVPEGEGAEELRRVEGRIAFRHVEFRYGEGEVVLSGVDLVVEPGQVVALVGASGAGKTSLVNLIPRFYDPTGGRIEIDGVDIAGVTLRSLRSQIGIVPQEPILFGGSVAENIEYGRPGAEAEEVRAAARAANAHEFVEALPEGYDTAVGERAAKLSGGQRQRIAIARALLRDPRILILDEATSALDAESEALVQDALERLMEGRTTVVIAHRLSTIQRADRILVLAGGRIAEDGRHDELLARGGAYRRLYEAQLSAGDAGRRLNRGRGGVRAMMARVRLAVELVAYNLVLAIFMPVLVAWLAWRLVARGKPIGSWRERFGMVRRLPAGRRPRIWVHAVSAGEMGAAQPVVKALREAFPGAGIGVSTQTAAGMAVATRTVEGADSLFYLPFEAPDCMGLALWRLRPDLVVVTEKELWPNLLGLARLAGARVLVVNGRVSDRMMRRAKCAPGAVSWLCRLPDRLCVQSEEDERRLRRLGVPRERVAVAGNTKADTLARRDREAEARLAGDLGAEEGEVWLVAGSTHPGEEEQVVEAFGAIQREIASARLLLAPRHLERVAAVSAALAQGGTQVVRRSDGEAPKRRDAVVILDTMGELRAAYGLGTAGFVGGTLAPIGGHNLLEPVAAGRAALFGPHTANCEDVADLVLAAGVGFRTDGAEELAEAFLRIARDGKLRAEVAGRAEALMVEQQGASARCAEAARELVGRGRAR